MEEIHQQEHCCWREDQEDSSLSREYQAKHSTIMFNLRFKEELQQYTHLIERECLNPDYLHWIEIDELTDVGFSETFLSQLYQSKPTFFRSSYQQAPPPSGKMSTLNGHLYGELVTLGYRSYQLSSNQDLIPVGTANDIFRLHFKQTLEEESYQTAATIIIKPNMVMANKNYYPAIGACEVQISTIHSISLFLQTRNPPEYDPRKVDVYQFGRSECGANDWILRGLTGEADAGQGRNKRGSVSRYSCRIVCSKQAPYTCRIYAGAFNESQVRFERSLRI